MEKTLLNSIKKNEMNVNNWKLLLLVLVFDRRLLDLKDHLVSWKRVGTIQYLAIQYAVGNGELMLECFPKHSRMGTARMK